MTGEYLSQQSRRLNNPNEFPMVTWITLVLRLYKKNSANAVFSRERFTMVTAYRGFVTKSQLLEG